MDLAGRVGVLGTGTMGAGIVQLAAQSGHAVIACDLSVDALERAQLYVRRGMERFAERGAFSEEEAETHYGRIHWSANAEELRDAYVVIEAIVEKTGPKREALALLDALLPAEACIFTNTSSIPISELASATGRPEKVCGTHFFTPPPVREAVEIPRGPATSEETLERAKDLVRSFGKRPVVVDGRVPGFVANRFLIPMLLEACRLLERDAAPKEDIDLIVKEGIGFPVGPFELGDLIGLDVALDVTSRVHEATGDPYYEPPKVLTDLVRSGRLGRKTGEGFYSY
ncbi:MAG: 3-hydroxybutyryl-CoA dehydrogenase; 3-hydroxyacyl-CoA dehydrogenase [uncultured Rubrobacteraceae bacterium]|uniref:3-hydroxybutyryl-CoA dehydrogenase 3-hydroxyacyl-CoA dehydrogenase n=1 Tax=uncultured Rubrobacteraceae bacterium TaxID=349277 RepID=A0A6J4SUD0_9ACTN|nr:MAG: 3-hydroxybutyryl-CoA dehydrogenase; 3-hydroxyacyl-CoA dehydrogenase [uncultured Rubrobacteraceae bacterium]